MSPERPDDNAPRAEALPLHRHAGRLPGASDRALRHVEARGPTRGDHLFLRARDQLEHLAEEGPEVLRVMPFLLVLGLAHQHIGAMGGLPAPGDAGLPVVDVEPERQRRRLGREVHLRRREHAARRVLGVARHEQPGARGADDPDGAPAAVKRRRPVGLREVANDEDGGARRLGETGEPVERAAHVLIAPAVHALRQERDEGVDHHEAHGRAQVANRLRERGRIQGQHGRIVTVDRRHGGDLGDERLNGRGHAAPGVPSGMRAPRETRAARSSDSVDLPSPGSPSSTVSLPRGIRPGQSHDTGRGVTSASRRRIGVRGSLTPRSPTCAAAAGAATRPGPPA